MPTQTVFKHQLQKENLKTNQFPSDLQMKEK